MNTKELNVIISAMENLGEAGYDGFLVYMGLRAFEVLTTIIITLIIATCIYKLVRYALSLGQTEKRMESLRDELGVGMSGMLVDAEFSQMIEKIRNLKSAAKEGE